jgi:hypothetical protein
MATVFNERRAQVALAHYFDWLQNKVFRNVMALPWEMDFCVLTKANYLWEVEIKVSLSDWKVDQFKDKWASKLQGKVKRFYYCVPWTMVDKVPDFVPEDVGLLTLHVSNDGKRLYVEEYRAAKDRKAEPANSDLVQRLLMTTYYKYWRKALL